MKEILLSLATAVTVLVVASGIALSLPSKSPDNTHMVNGTVRAIAQVGDNVWAGGNFSQVKKRDGTLVAEVSNLAVFDATTGQYKDVAPRLGGTGSQVRDIEVYGDDVVVGGSFGGPSSTQKNLVVLDGTTGQQIQWYNSMALQSVLAAPSLGRIYGGGVSLSAFDVPSAPTPTVGPLWTRSKTSVDTSLRPAHPISAGYRDLELDGTTIWAACACDAIDGRPTKALVKLNAADGAHDPSWVARDTGVGAFGISLAETDGALFLGGGGNDLLFRYSKADGGLDWKRDTSGSVQAVEVMGGGLVVGGHFVEVGDHAGDRCGFRSSDPLTLDAFGECRRRDGLAVYSFDGSLDSVDPATVPRVWGDKAEEGWNPVFSGMHDLVWALQPDELHPERLHFGGAFTKVDGITQTFYARLSEPGVAEADAPVVQGPDHDLTAEGTTLGTSAVPVKISWSATDEDGVSSYEFQESTDGGDTYKNVALASATATTKTLSRNPGGTYRYRVRATDGAGNVSAWAEGTPFTIDVRQEADASLAYSGTWNNEVLTTAFGGTTMHSEEAGAKATFTFTGADVSWAAQRGPDRGKAEVWLDGALVQTIDLYATTAQPRRVVYNATLTSSGSHTLEIKVLGTKRNASTGTRVDVDALVALP